LEDVWEFLLANTKPRKNEDLDPGAHYKMAEMSVARRELPKAFFEPGLSVPFNPSRPNFSLDLLARYITTVSRLDCGVNGIVFDLGVGYGWTTEWLVRLGYQAIGVDIARDYILAGLPRMGSSLPHLIVADVENIPLRNDCVDAVLSFDAFHHVPNRQRAMKELARIMQAGAKMVLVEPGKAHEYHPQSVAVMQQHGILERGFNKKDLQNYILGTPLGNIEHHRSDTHPHDIYTIKKAGIFETNSVKPRRLLAEIIVQPGTSRVASGLRPKLVVTLINRGDTTWLNESVDGFGEVYLGASLYDANHRLLLEEYAKVKLTRPLRPGNQVQLECELPPIIPAGSYIVELDMVVQGFLRFKDFAYQPALWFLTVYGERNNRISDDLLVPATSPWIVSRELSFGESPERSNSDGKTKDQRVVRLILTPWRLLLTEGPRSFGRKLLAYLKQHLT
jgi:SAM-dependent methyltransferase